MAQVINDLTTRFSFTGSVQPLHEYNATLGKAVVGMGAMLAAFNSANLGAAAWATTVLNTVDSIDALSYSTGVSVENIQRLTFAAEQNQSSSGAMIGTLDALSDAIGNAAQQGSDDFARLGISIRDANGQLKTSDVILEEVRRRFATMNLTVREQTSLASALGIDKSLLRLLNQTDAEMAALNTRARELGLITGEQTVQAMEYRKTLNQLWFSLNNVKQQIAIGMAPALLNLTEAISSTIATNKDWVVNGINAGIKYMGLFVDAANRLLPVLAVLTAAWVAMKIPMLLAFATNPVTLLIAAVSGLLLLVDDLIVAFRGGKSVIRDFFQNAFNIDIAPVLQLMVAKVKEFVSTVRELLSGIWSGVTGFFGIGVEPSRVPTLPAGGGSTSVDNRSVSQANTFNITASDPEAVGMVVRDKLAREFENASRQLQVGGQ